MKCPLCGHWVIAKDLPQHRKYCHSKNLDYWGLDRGLFR